MTCSTAGGRAPCAKFSVKPPAMLSSRAICCFNASMSLPDSAPAPVRENGGNPAILARPDGATIAYRRLAGGPPGIVFLGGFRSDMTGTKALFLEDYCRRRGRAYLRFDYFGHGASSGDFA